MADGDGTWVVNTPGFPDGYVPPSASLTPPPVDPAELAEAEVRAAAAWADTHHRRFVEIEPNAARVVLAEYERRGAVEKAAAALLRAAGGPEDEYREKLAALVTAVRTNGEFRG